MSLFYGVIPAILTPFDDDENINRNGIADELEYLSDSGIKSIFAGGSYGSFALLNVEDRKKLIHWTLDEAQKNNMDCIVQIGATSTRDTIELAKYAESNGATTVASVLPFYYSGSILKEDDFLRHFARLCDAVNIPVHVYNNPRATGVNISPKFLEKLIDVGLTGIKDGGGDVERLKEMLDVVRGADEPFNYIAGSTSLMFTSILSGADGCVSGVALVAPKLLIDYFNACKEKRVDDALVLQDKVMRIRSLLQARGPRAIACYEILHEMGVDVGSCKAPWQRMNEVDRQWLMDAMKEEKVV